MTSWNTYAYGPINEKKPEKLVLMLHGVGSNGQDLIGLAPYLAPSVPNALFLSPDAPYPYDMAGFGHQWFSLREYTEEAMLRGIGKTAPLLNDYIDAILADLDLKDSDLALLGFSQGTMMSLYAAPRRKTRIAGVMGYSGALLGGEALAASSMQKMPICLIHGDADEVLPVSRFYDAKQALEAAGFEVESDVSKGLGHSIDESGIQRGAAFLQRVLK